MDDRLYVLAGDYSQALFFAREKRIPRTKLKYLNARHDLDGIDGRGLTLHCYGTYYDKLNYCEIRDVAKRLGFTIKQSGG